MISTARASVRPVAIAKTVEHDLQGPNPPAPTLLNHGDALSRRTNNDRTTIFRMRCGFDEARLLELSHESRHARGANLLGGSEFAERHGSPENENRELALLKK